MVRGMVACRDVASPMTYFSWWWVAVLWWVVVGTAIAEYGLARRFKWKGTYPTIVVAWPVALVMALWFVYKHRKRNTNVSGS